MTETEFLDNFIPDRIRIISHDPNPNYVYALLNKHLRKSINELQQIYQVNIHTIRREITIGGSYSDIAELFSYLCNYGLKFVSISQSKLVIDLDHFITKIY